MENPEENEELWDEFKWEEFMKEQDRKVDRYMDLLTKYQDDPDCDEIVAREMGWTAMMEGDEKNTDNSDGDNSVADDIEKLNKLFSLDEEDEEDLAGEEWKSGLPSVEGEDPEERKFNELPVFKDAHEYALRAFDTAEKLPETVRSDSDVVDFVSNAMIAAAKIAGGASFNDDINMLGGSIAYCKRGLNASNRSLEALQAIYNRKVIDYDTYLSLHKDAKEVRDALALYIVELRERFQRGV